MTVNKRKLLPEKMKHLTTMYFMSLWNDIFKINKEMLYKTANIIYHLHLNYIINIYLLYNLNLKSIWKNELDILYLKYIK